MQTRGMRRTSETDVEGDLKDLEDEEEQNLNEGAISDSELTEEPSFHLAQTQPVSNSDSQATEKISLEQNNEPKIALADQIDGNITDRDNNHGRSAVAWGQDRRERSMSQTENGTN